MKLLSIVLAGALALAACNGSGKKGKVNVPDSLATVKKDTPVVLNRILPDDSDVGVWKGAVFIYKNRGFELFSGGPAMGKKYAEVINMYSRLKIPGLKIYNLIIPNGFEFEVREKYKNKVRPAKEAINDVYAAEDPGIIKVNPVDDIRKHRTEYLYFNTDHHWTSLGAYYAYTSFCGAAGLTPVSLANVPSKVKPGFLGFFYRLTRAASLKANPDSVRYYLFPIHLIFISEVIQSGTGQNHICMPRRPAVITVIPFSCRETCRFAKWKRSIRMAGGLRS
ncbi:MAG: hypothetical protein IPP93_14955 [Chitinophagaceae bacterium]|nr:hypothetical protein [Chitinophagaceae bacterium]